MAVGVLFSCGPVVSGGCPDVVGGCFCGAGVKGGVGGFFVCG